MSDSKAFKKVGFGKKKSAKVGPDFDVPVENCKPKENMMHCHRRVLLSNGRITREVPYVGSKCDVAKHRAYATGGRLHAEDISVIGGLCVSKRMLARRHKPTAWSNAIIAARKELGISGWMPLKGAYLKRAREINSEIKGVTDTKTEAKSVSESEIESEKTELSDSESSFTSYLRKVYPPASPAAPLPLRADVIPPAAPLPLRADVIPLPLRAEVIPLPLRAEAIPPAVPLRADVIPLPLPLHADVIPPAVPLRADVIPLPLPLHADVIPPAVPLRAEAIPLPLRAEVIPPAVPLRAEAIPPAVPLRAEAIPLPLRADVIPPAVPLRAPDPFLGLPHSFSERIDSDINPEICQCILIKIFKEWFYLSKHSTRPAANVRFLELSEALYHFAVSFLNDEEIPQFIHALQNGI